MAGKKKTAARPAPAPVAMTVTVQPVTRCAACCRPVTYPRQPGAAAAALTAHVGRSPACARALSPG